MSVETAMAFELAEGWTLRKVSRALAREWLPPFRLEPPARKAMWVVQSIAEEQGDDDPPLWEPGISTREYEERVDRADLCWTIRASIGRGNRTVLARLTMSKDRPGTFHLSPCRTEFPESLFDPDKVNEFLQDQGLSGEEGLLAAILKSKGFRPVETA